MIYLCLQAIDLYPQLWVDAEMETRKGVENSSAFPALIYGAYSGTAR